MKQMLLTGPTGVLGSRCLLEVLSNQPDTKIYCLIRARDEAHAYERLEAALDVYDSTGLMATALRDNVVPVLGELGKPYFGLDPAAYDQLAERIDLVMHVAANVNLFDSYERLAAINVRGIEQIIELCLAANARLLHTSSYSVLGLHALKPGFTFHEHDLDVGQRFDKIPYARSKMEAEECIHQAQSRGLQWTIVRPGNIFGDSMTGAYPLSSTTVTGVYYDIFKTAIETGLTFFTEDRFDMTPVDYVASALNALSQRPDVTNQTFHLVNQPIAFYALMNHLVSNGHPLRFVPRQEYIDLFRKQQVIVDGAPYRSTFASMMGYWEEFSSSQISARLDTRNAERVLHPMGIQCPPINEELVTVYLDYCKQVGFLRSPCA